MAHKGYQHRSALARASPHLFRYLYWQHIPIKGNQDHHQLIRQIWWAQWLLVCILCVTQHACVVHVFCEVVLLFPLFSPYFPFLSPLFSFLLPPPPSFLTPSHLHLVPLTPGIPHVVRRGRRGELRARECCCVLHPYLTVIMWLSCDHQVTLWTVQANIVFIPIQWYRNLKLFIVSHLYQLFL